MMKSRSYLFAPTSLSRQWRSMWILVCWILLSCWSDRLHLWAVTAQNEEHPQEMQTTAVKTETITASDPTIVQGPSSTTTTLHGRLIFPNGSAFTESCRILLNHGETYSTYPRRDGNFTMYHVPPGIHVLDVHHPIYHFSQVKVRYLPSAMDRPDCVEYWYAGATKVTVNCTTGVTLTALGIYEYFEPRKGFSILSIFKNPMMLMMLVTVGLMFLMPKMMENLDPEEKERMKQQMELQKDPSKLMGHLWGELTGGGSSEPDSSTRSKRIKQ